MFPRVVRVMSGLRPTRGKIWTVPCTRKLSSSEAKLHLFLPTSPKTAYMLAFKAQRTASSIPRGGKRRVEVCFHSMTVEQEEVLNSVPGEEKQARIQTGAQSPESHFVVQPSSGHLNWPGANFTSPWARPGSTQTLSSDTLVRAPQLPPSQARFTTMWLKHQKTVFTHLPQASFTPTMTLFSSKTTSRGSTVSVTASPAQYLLKAHSSKHLCTGQLLLPAVSFPEGSWRGLHPNNYPWPATNFSNN